MIRPTAPVIEANRVVLTGRRRAGKDYVAEKNGYEVCGFADPMYEIAERFLGSSDKEDPGVLEFIYKLGAWGRGEVSEKRPLTAERHRITETIRSEGEEFTGIPADWRQFGKTPEFWIDVLERRIEQAPPGPIAITNARFPEEIVRFVSGHGFEHRHVMCSEKTRKRRLGEETCHGPSDRPGELPKTEQLAAWLDRMAKSDDLASRGQFVPRSGQDPAFPMEAPGGDVIDLGEELTWELVKDVAGGSHVVWNDPEVSPEETIGEQKGITVSDADWTVSGSINATSGEVSDDIRPPTSFQINPQNQ